MKHYHWVTSLLQECIEETPRVTCVVLSRKQSDRKGKIVPRLRLFLWKLLNEALPLGHILTSRMHRGDPTCHMCGAQSETVRSEGEDSASSATLSVEIAK